MAGSSGGRVAEAHAVALHCSLLLAPCPLLCTLHPNRTLAPSSLFLLRPPQATFVLRPPGVPYFIDPAVPGSVIISLQDLYQALLAN